MTCMSDPNKERRDEELMLFYPGPRRGELSGEPLRERVKASLYRKLNKDTGVLSRLESKLRDLLDQPRTSRERVVEYPFVYRHLSKEPPSNILVAGGSKSAVAYTLASLGYQTKIVDLDGYSLKHRNLEAVTGDLTNLRFSDASFDAVVMVSVIEHVGMSKSKEQADKNVFFELDRVLAPQGELIFTTPFAKEYTTLSNSRIYSWDRIEKAVPENMKFEIIEVYGRNGNDWFPIERSEAVPFDMNLESAICCRLVKSNDRKEA